MLVGLMAGGLSLCLALVTCLSVVARVSQAQAAVDAVALEAADIASGRIDGVVCGSAAEAARAEDATLTSCAVDGHHARVVFTLNVGVLSFLVRAHAGPSD